jgi:hypothetical protein
MKLIWADRVAIFWAALCSLFFFCVNGREAISGMLSDPSAMFVLFVVPWIAMRLFALLFQGRRVAR